MGRTIDDVAGFCREENTFGALLLSGEWGCGKTYLLENDLPKELGEGYAMIRISLFGETSVEEIRRKIQKAYFNKLLEYAASDEERSGQEDSVNAWIYKVEELTGVEKIYALNPSEYIRLETRIAGRPVILIFDDLERCHLSQAEILGCINEYCENLHLKTIIVANESKINDWQQNKTKNREEGRKDFLVYSEIKEKIIARTVKMTADYETIVANIIRCYRTNRESYRTFLQAHQVSMIQVLETCEIRNLRSFRCGLQDFEKVHEVCQSEKLTEEEILGYFTSFLVFELLARGGQISKSEHFGYGLNRLAQKYPGLYMERFMPDCLKDWVLSGSWDGEESAEQIRRNAKLARRTMEPQHRIRSMFLMEMDDETLEQGWKAFLDLAYEGRLNLNEYVRFLQNMISAREYEFTWPISPDMERLDAGITRAFARICESDNGQKLLRERMDEAELRKCTAEEWRIYGRIVSFNDSKAYLYGVNRNQILAALASGKDQEFFKCRSYDIQGLDPEIAEAMVACYRTLDSNQRRINYIDTVRVILKRCMSVKGSEESHRVLEQMKEQAAQICESEAVRPLRAIANNYFLRMLEEF